MRVRPPTVGHDDAFFWEGAAAGRLLVQRCATCGELRHPPGPMCPRCHSLEWDTVASSGHGRVLSWILSHHPTRPDDEPRVVVLVALDEGTRLVSNLIDGPDLTGPDRPTLNGRRVSVTFVDHEGTVLPQFRLAETEP